MDSRCKSLITAAFIVSLYTVIQNAEAGHSAYVPGVLDYWSVGVLQMYEIPNSEHPISGFQCSASIFLFPDT